MTRFEKWLSQQDYGTRANMICQVSMCSKCPIASACRNTGAVPSDSDEVQTEKWNKACEEYLDEEWSEENG